MRAGASPAPARAGFTLVELLLTLVLILLLFAAVAFNFSSLQQGAALDEGASQFETLLRMARAHAAASGCAVKLLIAPAAGETNSFPAATVQLWWEPQPIDQPGTWRSLNEPRWNLPGLNELVIVEDAVSLEQLASIAGPDSFPGGTDFPAVLFYPDGSSDSAEFVLASRQPEDQRRFAVRLIGLTGNITRYPVDPEDNSAALTNQPVGLQPLQSSDLPAE